MEIIAFLKSGHYVVGHYDGVDDVGDMLTFVGLIDKDHGLDSLDYRDMIVDFGARIEKLDPVDIVSTYNRIKSLILDL